MRFAVWTIALALCSAVGWAAETRSWTDRTRRYELEAKLVDLREDRVRLARTDGTVVTIGLSEFSAADQRYIREEIRRRRAALKAEVSGEPGTICYGPGRELCKLASPLVDESSGLACSRNLPGVFWTHNDSGDLARLYAFDERGRDRGACLLADVLAYDLEDMASFVLGGKHYLLVGDTGNNGLAATVQILYLIEEPPIDGNGRAKAKRAPVVQIMNYCYEDDHRDCEALAVDPTTRTILLVSKENGSSCYVYALAWPKNNPDEATVARKIATLKVPPVTAMDVSPDGRRAAVSTYGNAYEYTRRANEDWAAAFSRRPAEIIVPQRVQGESICYGPDGKTLYLTSEKLPTPLIEIPVKQQPKGAAQQTTLDSP